MPSQPVRFRPSWSALLLAAPVLLIAAPLVAAPIQPDKPALEPMQKPNLAPTKRRPAIQARFTVSGATVRDSTTGLTWEKAPPDSTFDWNAARTRCDGLVLGGHGDWRIPRVEEIRTLFQTDPPDTFLVKDHPFTVTTQQRWTATGNPATRFAILVSNGNIHHEPTTEAIAVWCVRGGANTAYPGSSPRFQYVDGTNYKHVLDKQTGLIWRAQPTGYGDWFHVRAECRQEGPGWRLATAAEYTALIDLTAPGSPKLPVGHPFANTYPPTYDVVQRWSSTQPTTAAATAVRLADAATTTVDKLTVTPSGFCVKGDPAAVRFSLVDGDGAVLDHDTQLVWARAPIYVKDTHAAHKAACAARDGASVTGWRLPTVREFRTILDQASPTRPKLVAGHLFTDLRTDSSQMMWTADASTAVAFKTADIGYATVSEGGYHKDSKHHAWCVRAHLP